MLCVAAAIFLSSSRIDMNISTCRMDSRSGSGCWPAAREHARIRSCPCWRSLCLRVLTSSTDSTGQTWPWNVPARAPRAQYQRGAKATPCSTVGRMARQVDRRGCRSSVPSALFRSVNGSPWIIRPAILLTTSSSCGMERHPVSLDAQRESRRRGEMRDGSCRSAPCPRRRPSPSPLSSPAGPLGTTAPLSPRAPPATHAEGCSTSQSRLIMVEPAATTQVRSGRGPGTSRRTASSGVRSSSHAQPSLVPAPSAVRSSCWAACAAGRADPGAFRLAPHRRRRLRE